MLDFRVISSGVVKAAKDRVLQDKILQDLTGKLECNSNDLIYSLECDLFEYDFQRIFLN